MPQACVRDADLFRDHGAGPLGNEGGPPASILDLEILISFYDWAAFAVNYPVRRTF